MMAGEHHKAVIPSSFRRRSAFGFWSLLCSPVFALVFWGLDTIDFPGDSVSLSWTALSFVAGGVLVVRAAVLRSQPTLVLDTEGIRDRRGRLLVLWSDAALIWVGDTNLPGFRLPGTQLVVFTASALGFAERTGLEPEARLVRTAEGTMSARQFAGVLERFATCPVRVGDVKDYKSFIRGYRLTP